jgi:hypothetical protein
MGGLQPSSSPLDTPCCTPLPDSLILQSTHRRFGNSTNQMIIWIQNDLEANLGKLTLAQ